MKNLLLLTIASLVLAAVICTAGCTTTEDVLVGSWYYKDESGISYAEFSSDGKGVFYSVNSDGTVTERTHGLWKNDGENIYTITRGEIETKVIVNPQKRVMNADGVVYQKKVSAGSGATLPYTAWKKEAVKMVYKPQAYEHVYMQGHEHVLYDK